MSIVELVRAEKWQKELILTGQGSIEERAQRARAHMPVIAPPDIPEEAQSLPPGLRKASVSASTFRHIFAESHAQSLRSQQVSTEHIEEARSYVQALLGVDLSRVQVEVLPNALWDDENAEASTFRSGIDEHLILIPEDAPCSPTELLVHEFGHTGHFTAQRQTAEYPFYWTTPITAELVAHFCQYNFLLERGTRTQFAHALLQFVQTMYALSVLESGSLSSFDRYLASDASREIRNAWPRDNLAENFVRFQENQPYLMAQCQRGISQLLALTLVDRREEMRRFVRLDRLDHSLAAKLQDAFPADNVLDGFPQVDAQISDLWARFAR